MTRLLPYQHEGLAWMCNQEEEADCRGGVLADEMGMGKTLQMISLIIKRRPQVQGPTLVVCPLAAVVVWVEEIRRSVSPPGLLKVHVYLGTKKAVKAELEQYDVVITSYNTLETQYRSLTAIFERVVCQYCKRSFKLSSLPAHHTSCIKEYQRKKNEKIAVKCRETVKREMDSHQYRTPERRSMVKLEGGSSRSTMVSSECKMELSPCVKKTIIKRRSTPPSARRVLGRLSRLSLSIGD